RSRCRRPSASYNFRFFRDNTYTLLATSPLITVSGAPAPTPTPTPLPGGSVLLVNGSSSPITVAPGANVTVNVSGGPASRLDWVAKHISTDPNNKHFGDWQYLNGSQ